MENRSDEIIVSICCITYNHEKYIKDTIEGFLSQKTSFAIEIIIHDDASVDSTAEIIKKYQKLFPDIIKPIFQSENQYSKKNVTILQDIVYPKAKGKYIALCEGDDYWIDPYKLEKQVRYMNKNPNCSLIYTNAYTFDEKNKIKKVFIDESISSTEITLDNISLIEFPPTASYVIRKTIINKIPDDYKSIKCQAGDFKTRLYCTSKGYTYYLNDITCVYRINVPNSAMYRWKEFDRKEYFWLAKGYVDIIDYIDKDTNYHFSEGLFKSQKKYCTKMLLSVSSHRILVDLLHKSIFYRVYREKSLFDRLKIQIKSFIPENILKFIRKWLKWKKKY